MIHPEAYAHFDELTRNLPADTPSATIGQLRALLLATLHSAYTAAQENGHLLHQITELKQTIHWQRLSIDELTNDRSMLLTVIEQAACMPPLFIYSRRAAGIWAPHS